VVGLVDANSAAPTQQQHHTRYTPQYANSSCSDGQNGGKRDDDDDVFKLDAAVVTAAEAVKRKETRCVKLWLSKLDVVEWKELAGDRLGRRKALKSTTLRT
jgi:hypothetical protein